MNREDLKAIIIGIASEVFLVNKELINNEDFMRGDIEEWDSLGHIKLFLALEKKLKIKFSTEDILKLDSVKKITDKSLELFA